MIDPLSGKKVAVLGFARQGRALGRWLPSVGAQTVVSDERSAERLGLNREEFPDVEFVLGGHPDSLLDGVDVLAISSGIALNLPIIQTARERGIPLTNDAQLFLERCPAPCIGITGSAGKTTTTTLVGEIMRRAYERVWVGGNIGDVLLDVLPSIRPDHYVVMELSSFQLELMTVSPDIAVILNVTPNHLDRHETMEAYTAAKANIFAYQDGGGITVLGRDDAGAKALADKTPGQLVWFSAREMVSEGAFLAGERMVLSGIASPDRNPIVVGERGDIRLRGEHNVLNILAACAITGAAQVVPEIMMNVIREFKGVAHRLELVAELDGVMWVNDSIATAPERVTAALRSYTKSLVLLLGGRDKKLPWDEMLRLALTKSRAIIAFGELGDLVVETARRLNAPDDAVVRVGTLDEAVTRAAEVAQTGDVVLLSPGGTSYDAYVDFAERGEHFRALVTALHGKLDESVISAAK